MARKILFEIEVENTGATRRLESLREEIRRLNKEIKGAEVGSPVYNDLINKISSAKQEAAALKEQQKALNREFQAARVPADSLAGLRLEYAKLADQIRLLSAAERQSPFGQSLIKNAATVKKEIDGIEQSIGRFTGNVGNYRSAFQGLSNVLLSIGAGFGVSEIIQQNTQLSDSIANVAKTTGLTIEEAEKLAEALKFRDTRTALADQLQIAEIGGQLGIANTQIQAFTQGVDVLNVALGDQFGNVEILTREFAGLRNVLTDFRTEDAAGDILKLGNAINFLEAEGNATGQSIVDFASRIAGAGVPLGATTSQIVGLSTALSELSINPERGATAVSRLLTELARAPELFAQAIGEPTDTFRKLVETDIVGALSLVSERVATSSETNIAFAQTLDELGIGSQGAIEVFGKLGGATDLLKTRIAQAGETLQNTDSITREFEVKNNNAAAAVEKLRNAIIGAFTSSDAQDAIAAIAAELTVFVNVLAEVPGLLAENKDEVLLLAAAFIYLNRQGIISAIPLLGTLTQNFTAMTTATGRATVATNINAAATRALGAAQAALPFLAVIAGVYAIVKAFDAYEESLSATEKASRTVAEAQKDLAKDTAAEISAVRTNIEVLKAEGVSKESKKKAIQELTAAYPAYLKGIDLEKAGVSQLTALQEQLTESIIKSGAERLKQSATAEIEQKIINERLRRDRLLTKGFTDQEKALNALTTAGNAAKTVFTEGLFGLGDVQAPTVENAVEASNRREQELLKQREETVRQFDRTFRIGEQELTLVVPERATAGAKELGDAAEKTGDKIQGLGGKSKTAKDEIQAQAGSVDALNKQVSDLQKQIDATSPDSPALAGLIRQLQDAKNRAADAKQALLGVTFRQTFGELAAPEIPETEQPDIGFAVELEPDAETKLKNEILAAREAAENAIKAIEFPVEAVVPKEQQDAIKEFEEQQEKGAKERREREDEEFARQAQKRLEVNEALQEAAISTAQTIAGAVFEIQRGNIERERDEKLAALDAETAQRIEAAAGNQAKITAIEKDAEKKKQAIEKEAAKQRKQAAVKEAIINTALAITKALTGAIPPFNFILAGVAAAAGAAQIAVINAQEFAEGGTVKRLEPGKVTEKQNAPRTAKGDTVLAYLAPGEMVLNEPQQNTIRSLFGKDAFALAGVPGESAARRSAIPGFASGGVVGVVPQNGFNAQVSAPVTVEAKAEFSQAQIEQIAEIQGRIIAAQVSAGVFTATALGIDEKNRMLEREQIAAQNRRG